MKSIFLFGSTILVLFAGVATAQQTAPTPQLFSVYPTGAQVGKTIEMKILDEDELEFCEQLVFSHDGITAKPTLRKASRFFPKPTAVRNSFQVSVAKNVPPGVYEVRGLCEYGLSNPRRFVVSQSNESSEQEPNDRISQANPIKIGEVVNGLFEAGYDYFSLPVTTGDSLIIQCFSERIDSDGDPVLAILDEEGKMIAKNHDAVGKDSVVHFVADSDRTLIVRVNDLVFRSANGAGTTPYRLLVNRNPWIDFVDPPVVKYGEKTKVKVYGRNLGGTVSNFLVDGRALEFVEVELQAPNEDVVPDFSNLALSPSSFYAGQFAFRFQNQTGQSNPIMIGLTNSPLKMEAQSKKEPAINAQAAQVEILGVFSTAGESDQYRVTAKKNDKLWLEVISQRLGIGTDPLLRVELVTRDKEGVESFRTIKSIDDFQPMASPYRMRLETEDPAELIEFPQDGEYRIVVTDQFNLPANFRGPNYYRLKIQKPSVGVSLVAFPGLQCGPNDNNSRPLKVSPCIVRRNSAAEVQVFAYRTAGFDLPITITATGLPDGVTADPVVLHGQSNHVTLILRGAANLASGVGTVNIEAQATVDGKPVKFPVAAAEICSNAVGNTRTTSRLGNSFVVSLDEKTVFPGHIELPERRFETSIGGKLQPKAKLKKSEDFKGTVQQAFVHGLPRTVTKNTNSLAASGTEVSYNIDFRQAVPTGEYTVFLRGYVDQTVKRFEEQFKQVTAEQKRISTEVQKVESEYRSATQRRQRAERDLAQKKQALTAAKTSSQNQKRTVDQANAAVKTAEKKKSDFALQMEKATSTVKSLNEKISLEQDATKKQTLANEINTAKSQLQQKKTQLAQVEAELANAKKNQESQRKKMIELETAEKKSATELMKAEQENTTAKADEEKLSKERQAGQTIKREIDQELNVARQANQQRSRRFMVYSDPIRISVAALPIDYKVSQSNFKIQAGGSQDFSVDVTRKYGFKGDVSVQIRPESGASGWTLAPNAKVGGSAKRLDTKLKVASSGKPGNYSGEILLEMRFGSARLTKSIPIQVEVLPQPAKK